MTNCNLFFFATLFLTLKRFTYFHRLCCTFISQSISFSVQIHKSTYVRVIFWFGLKFTTGPSRRIRGRHLPPSPRRFSADRSEAAIVIFSFFWRSFFSSSFLAKRPLRPQNVLRRESSVSAPSRFTEEATIALDGRCDYFFTLKNYLRKVVSYQVPSEEMQQCCQLVQKLIW